MGSLELIFLGTGTSAGIPMIGCHCPVCSSVDPRDKRMRCSVVVRYGDTQVLVDTTPELRLQCVANRIDRIDSVVFTHAHADHIMGLDDCRRFNAIKKGPLDVWGDEATFAALRKCFDYAFNEPPPELKVFRPHLVARTIDGPFEIGGMTWTPVPMLHGNLLVNGFRIGDLAYCTDVNEMPEASYALLENLDLLILDGLQWSSHATHFSVEQAMEVAARIKPKRVLFTHMSHQILHAEAEAKLPPGMNFAYDGLRVTVAL